MIVCRLTSKLGQRRDLLACRTRRRSSALKPFIARSMANSASIRVAASSAIGETGAADGPRRAEAAMSASSKKPRRACAQQSAERTAPTLRAGSYRPL
jgi:hypothetical protein